MISPLLCVSLHHRSTSVRTQPLSSIMTSTASILSSQISTVHVGMHLLGEHLDILLPSTMSSTTSFVSSTQLSHSLALIHLHTSSFLSLSLMKYHATLRDIPYITTILDRWSHLGRCNTSNVFTSEFQAWRHDGTSLKLLYHLMSLLPILRCRGYVVPSRIAGMVLL